MRPHRRHLALVIAGLMAAPLIGRAAALSITSEHLTTVATCGLISFPPSAVVASDTFADEKNPTAVNGTNNNINVQSNTGTNQRGYVRFDLTKCIFAPPAAAIVRGAWLRLWVNKQPPTCRTYDVFALASAWSDSTLDWSNQPNPPGTTINNPPSGQRTSATDLGNVSTCANHTNNVYVSWDVTADVARFVAGTATNDGWMIRDDVEDTSPGQPAAFFATEANHNNQAPQLMISYTLA